MSARVVATHVWPSDIDEPVSVDGLELVNFLRNDENNPNPHIPIIMLTGPAAAQYRSAERRPAPGGCSGDAGGHRLITTIP